VSIRRNRWLAAGVAAVGFLTALSVVNVSSAQPSRVGTNVSTCNNPVLNKALTEWGPIRGTAPIREPVADHQAARFGYMQRTNTVTNPSFYLPQQPVGAGEQWTFAHDVSASAAGRARLEVDWYSTPEGDNTGHLGHTDGMWTSFAANAGWTRIAGDFTAPAAAIRADVLTDHEYTITGNTFRATACDYRAGTFTPPPPPSGDGTEAAVRYGWGTPQPISDEFNYTGPVDPAKWAVPSGNEGGTAGCWPGHAGNGRRCAKNTTVADGIMTMTGQANGDTGWLKQKLDRQYGRWEIRSRSRNTGSTGGLYHPLHLIWPTSEDRLRDGEYDWVEYTNPDAQCLVAFLHYPQSPTDQKERAEHCPVDMTQWHNFAFEWTPQAVVGYIDGIEWFRYSGGANSTRGNIQAMPSGHLNIQLDNFTGNSGLRPAVFEVDWVHTYN
jgi:hypothetical protein